MELLKGLESKLPSLTSLIATPIGIVSIILLAAIVTIVYQVHFHPLRHVPGPFWAKVFAKYMKVSEARFSRAHDLLALHKKYGPIVRVGANEVSISTPKVYRDIFNNKTVLRDARFYEPKAFIGKGNVFSAVNPEEHAGRRKIIAPTFTHHQIIGNEALIIERIDVFMDRVLRGASKSNYIDVFDLVGLMSIEIICKICFNTDFEQRPDFSKRLLHSMEGGALSIALSTLFPFLAPLQLTRKIPGMIGKAFRDLDEWKELTAELLTELKNQQWGEATLRKFNAGPLLLDKNKYFGRHLDFYEVVEEAMGLAIAGSGVTQHELLYLFYALGRPENRAIQLRLRNELLSQVGPSPSFSDVANLPYLTAVLKETYRLYPVIMSTLPRVITTPLTVPDSGITLPPQTIVGMQNFVHHRDPDIFPNPKSFVPERWLEGESKLGGDQSLMNSSLTPFSTGAYNCIGQSLARIELYLAVSYVFRTLDISVHSSMTEDDMFMQDTWAVLPKGGKLLLNVKPLEEQN